MITTVRILGWAANIMLAALLAAGFSGYFSIAVHVGWGLGVTLFLPLVYLLPYFHLIGVTSRLRGIAEEDADSMDAFLLAVKLKARLFWPTLLCILLCLAGPILGYLQLGRLLPQMVHGTYMVLFIAIHVYTWVRSLFILSLAAELTEISDAR